MIISRHKLVLAALVSGVSLSLLLASTHLKFPNLSRAEPRWLSAVLAAHLLMVSARGLAFRALARRQARAAILKWIHLAARHQLVFSIVPGGVGDAGFPYFAKRIAGVDAHDSVRMIAQFRVRDLILIALMGLSGLILLGVPSSFALLVAAPAIPVLWFSDDITVGMLRLAIVLAPHSRLVELLRRAADQEPPTAPERLVRTAIALIVWSASTMAVMFAFRAVGAPIEIAEALVFIAAVNFAGAISTSIAGFGPSEAGATAALVVAGSSIQRASSLALVVRPLLLISVVCCSAFLDLAMLAVCSRDRFTTASTP